MGEAERVLSAHTRVLIALFVVALVVVACSSDGGESAEDTDASPPSSEASTDDGEAAASEDETPNDEETQVEEEEPESESTEAPGPDSGDSAYLFDQDELRTYDITISEENLAELDADPVAEEWVDAALEFEGHDIGAVGMRYKGSAGAWIQCLTGTEEATLDNPITLINPSGAKVCPKLSMKLKINWEDSKDEMYGVRTLQFHAMNNDRSQLRERLGYWFFNEAGAVAPRAVHARVNINGEYAGLFILVEQLDGRFTRDRFEDGKGNLFKQVWPVTSDGAAQSEATLVGALETNEDEASVELMSRFSNELAAASPEDQAEVVERWVDIDEIIANQVVDRLIRHDDGPSNFRCFGGTACMLNNYYWYMDPTTEIAHLVAWDLDISLDSIEHPLVQVDSDWGEIRNNCETFDIGTAFVQQRSAACDPLFAGLLEHSDKYRATLDEFVNGIYAPDAVEERLTTWIDQIDEATSDAYAIHGDEGLSPEEWQLEIDSLLGIIDEARTEVVAAAEDL